MEALCARVLECEFNRRDWTRIRFLSSDRGGDQVEDVLQEAYDGGLLPHARLGVIAPVVAVGDLPRGFFEAVRVVEYCDDRSARWRQPVNKGEKESPAAGAEQGRDIPALLREI
ncbi:hypothetical protein [Kytococcus sedentarius]|uniref:hypothetical protein n=1 Tax=Kytococcus sedentarius TaxID=1276 RepID=UPI00066045A9|nr:hypothetical protein [Kytococcus sedentarius]